MDGRSPSIVMGMVARRYYLERRAKNEIAAELGISRFRVARLLAQAFDAGVVTITVHAPASVDLELGRELADAYGLANAVVVDTSELQRQDALDALATAGAEYLQDVVSPGEVLGLSWGSSVAALVDRLSELPTVDVVQLAGALRVDGREVSGAEIVRRVAVISGGDLYPLHAPLVLKTPGIAQALRQEPGVRRTLQAYASLTTAVVGIGAWSPGQSALYREMTLSEIRVQRAVGAVADICGHVLGGNGKPLNDDTARRLVGISWADLDRVRRVIGIAGGASKHRAIAAVLRGGLLDTLITDTAAARRLLAAHEDEPR